MGDDRSVAATSPLLIPAEIRSDILRRISSEGSFAYVTSVESAAASGDLRAAEAAREMAWEQLHSGPWHEVGPVWRDAYAMACLHVAKIREGFGELQKATKVLDLGIIMRGVTLRKDLDAAVERIAKARRSEEERVMMVALESDEKFDLQKVHSFCANFFY